MTATHHADESALATTDEPPPDEPSEASPTEPPSPSPRDNAGADSGAGTNSLVLDLDDATRSRSAADLDELRLLVRSACAHAGVTGGELRVRLVGDTEMAAAHLEHCGIEGTTDVITFDLSDHQTAGELDTDLFVCVDEATRQAEQRGHSAARELLLYILHGVLHCLGYDDTDEQSFERIHAREDEILGAMGVGETFGDRGAESGGGR